MKKAEIIILSGQSNAVGVGRVECLPLHFDEKTIGKWREGFDKILINYYSHDKKSNGFVKTTLGCTEATKFTIGPEIGIAEALSEKYPEKEFFIVKCAYGGMSLHTDFLSPSGDPKYDPEAYASQKKNIVEEYGIGEPIRAGWAYNELVKLLSESISYLSSIGYEPEVKAFCWMQGENDACLPETTNQYARLYDCMLRDLAGTFKGVFDHCVYVDAGISEIWPLYKELNGIKKAYAESRDNCRYIDTIGEGLTTKNEPAGEVDIYHYDSDCVVKLGRLFVREFEA